MSLLGDVSGGLMSGAADIISKFVGDPDKEKEINLELKKLIHAEVTQKEQTLRTSMQARERVMVAELNQSDNYTKRARPTTVYFGLVMIAFNYCIVPVATMFTDIGLKTLDLPVEFWAAWGGVVATWSIGRTAERVGFTNKAVRAVTGSKIKPKKTENDDWLYEGD